MPLYRKVHRFGIILVLLFLFALTSLTLAQNAVPIQIGQNAVAELTAEINILRYSLTTLGSETASVQVLALSPALIPRFRVLNPSGVEILTATNPNALSSLTADASLPGAGTYIIEVSGENGTFGQFVLSLQAGAPLPQAVELAAGQPVSSAVSSTAPLALYHFSTTAEITSLTIRSDTPDTGVLVSLFDETAGKTILTSDASVRAARYQLAPEDRSYRLEIHASDAPEDTPYTVCFGVCEGSNGLANALGNLAVVSVTPEVSALNCTVASATGGTVNVRGGAGTQFAIVGSLSASQPLPALGRLADGSWIQVSLPNGSQGWVAASVTRLEGDCDTLPIVAAPLNAALAPTLPPAPTNPPPTTASSGGGTAPTTEPPPAATLPDISITISNVVYIELVNGDTIANMSYTLVVRDVTNPISYRLQICVDNTCIFDDRNASVSSSDNIFRSMPFTPDGRRITHRATLTVDSTNNVVESNESNNVATYDFQT